MRTDLDSLAEQLNGVVIIGEDAWKLILLGTVSPYAPRIEMNSIRIRNNIHVMLAGDVSTAKSQTMEVLKKVRSPPGAV